MTGITGARKKTKPAHEKLPIPKQSNFKEAAQHTAWAAQVPGSRIEYLATHILRDATVRPTNRTFHLVTFFPLPARLLLPKPTPITIHPIKLNAGLETGSATYQVTTGLIDKGSIKGDAKNA